MYNKKYKYAVLWGFVRKRQKISRFCTAIPQSRLTPSQLPLHKGAKIKFHSVIKFVFKSWL